MVFLRTCLFFALMSISTNAFAEYRVFLLEIGPTTRSNPDQSPADEKPTAQLRYVASTLDPLQYKYYYPVQTGEMVTYTQTWMCRGRTGNGTPLCPNPKAKVETETETPTN